MIKFAMALALLVSLSGCFFPPPDHGGGPRGDRDRHDWSHDNGYHGGDRGDDSRGRPY